MINLMNLFGGGQMGTNLFGAPKMFNDMPEPGMPMTGAPDGVAPPPSPLLSGGGGNTSMLGGLGGNSPDVLRPPGAAPPPAGPPMPVPQPSLKPIPPSAASQLPPPATGPGSDRAIGPAPPPTLPTMAAGGVGPDQPVAPAPATTGSTPPANTTQAGEEANKNTTLQDFLERAGQVKFGEGGGAGVKPANIGSAGAPHIPQGASALFQSIMEGHQKAMPQVAKVPDMAAIMQRLGMR
jgi:hypothetical protein